MFGKDRAEQRRLATATDAFCAKAAEVLDNHRIRPESTHYRIQTFGVKKEGESLAYQLVRGARGAPRVSIAHRAAYPHPMAVDGSSRRAAIHTIGEQTEVAVSALTGFDSEKGLRREGLVLSITNDTLTPGLRPKERLRRSLSRQREFVHLPADLRMIYVERHPVDLLDMRRVTPEILAQFSQLLDHVKLDAEEDYFAKIMQFVTAHLHNLPQSYSPHYYPTYPPAYMPTSSQEDRRRPIHPVPYAMPTSTLPPLTTLRPTGKLH